MPLQDESRSALPDTTRSALPDTTRSARALPDTTTERGYSQPDNFDFGDFFGGLFDQEIDVGEGLSHAVGLFESFLGK